MQSLVQASERLGYRARADRPIQSGRVISVNSADHTAILDVGMIDANGNAVYMIDVPYSPQTPPRAQDTVAIMRTNSSPYSMVVGAGAQVGGANSGQVVSGVGGTGSLSTPSSRGQILYCEVPGTWVAATPLVSDTGEILTEDATGYIVVQG